VTPGLARVDAIINHVIFQLSCRANDSPAIPRQLPVIDKCIRALLSTIEPQSGSEIIEFRRNTDHTGHPRKGRTITNAQRRPVTRRDVLWHVDMTPAPLSVCACARVCVDGGGGGVVNRWNGRASAWHSRALCV
jgi:hypothetical protein